ncbi:hypothetical protein Hamer_G026370, partial [Homarus americanus]
MLLPKLAGLTKYARSGKVSASNIKLFKAVRSLLFGDSVVVILREDHGEASQVNVAESRSVNDELRLLEGSWTRSPPNGASKFSTYTCSFCGKPGHKAGFCWTRLQPNTGKPAMIVTEEANTSPVGVMAGLSKADSMPIALVSTKVSVLASRDFNLFQESFAKDPDVGTFRLFLSQGTVEVDGVETPVTILRDSGFSKLSSKRVLLRRGRLTNTSFWAPFGVKVKLFWFWYVSRIANVACVHELPVAGVDLILGNDLAGGQMGNVTPPPVLRGKDQSLPQSCNNLNIYARFLRWTFFANPIASQDISYAVNALTGRVALIGEQEQDDSLRLLFDQVSDPANDSGPTTRY